MCPECPETRAGQAGMGKDRQMPARTQVSPHAAAARSHGVVENNILLGQLQQHGVVEELADAHIFAQALRGNGKARSYSFGSQLSYSHCSRDPTKKPWCPAVREIFRLQRRQENLQSIRCFSAA